MLDDLDIGGYGSHKLHKTKIGITCSAEFRGQAVGIVLAGFDWKVVCKRLSARIHNPTAPPVCEATKEIVADRRAALRDGDRELYKRLSGAQQHTAGQP